MIPASAEGRRVADPEDRDAYRVLTAKRDLAFELELETTRRGNGWTFSHYILKGNGDTYESEYDCLMAGLRALHAKLGTEIGL